MFRTRYTPCVLVIVCLVCLCFSCTATNEQVKYTPSNPSLEKHAQIKKDVVDKAIEYGTARGYAPLEQDYNKGYVKLQRRYSPIGISKVTWTIIVSCTTEGQSIIAHVYTPDDAPDVTDIHEKLMSLYK